MGGAVRHFRELASVELITCDECAHKVCTLLKQPSWKPRVTWTLARSIPWKFSVCQKEILSDENALPLINGIILQIEDDLEDVELFRIALAQNGSGCQLISVQFAKDAINYLCRIGQYIDAQRYPRPTLIVLDLSLPGMSGLEFLTWAKCEPPDNVPPIVVFSSSQLELNRDLTQKLGAKGYFVKSPDLKETVAMTKDLLFFSVSPPNASEWRPEHTVQAPKKLICLNFAAVRLNFSLASYNFRRWRWRTGFASWA